MRGVVHRHYHIEDPPAEVCERVPTAGFAQGPPRLVQRRVDPDSRAHRWRYPCSRDCRDIGSVPNASSQAAAPRREAAALDIDVVLPETLVL